MAQNLDKSKLNLELELNVAERTRELCEINTKLKQEIRERQEAQQALIISEARYRGLFNNIPMGIALLRVVLDEQGNFIDNEFVDANRACMLYNGENIVGRRVKDVFPDLDEDIREKFAEVALTGQPITIEVYSEIRKAWIRMWAYSLEKEQFVVISKDITEQKKYEEELARFDRLNLVGEMAAGIGHEIRNPMTTVRGYLQMFQRKDQFGEYQNQLDTMIEELDRANEIITEFLSLAKNKRVDLKPGNLNGTIHALFPLLQAEAFRLGHELETDIGDISPCCYDDKEIRQLILNLVRNGFEAMEARGMLSIKTYQENDKVIMVIQDNGPGIPPEVLSRLGTPFVSTKESGTGLGLSVCYRIAERNQAKIEVTSSINGTTFLVKFMVLKNY
ncbi:MAG: kinE 1 [Firmicutes bacterium]|nr:kinE 1 [Bacillota bacterium]